MPWNAALTIVRVDKRRKKGGLNKIDFTLELNLKDVSLIDTAFFYSVCLDRVFIHMYVYIHCMCVYVEKK